MLLSGKIYMWQRSRKSMKRSWWQNEQYTLIISSALLVIDQLLKLLFYSLRPDIDAILFRLHYVQNTGASFGIMQSQNSLLIWISIIALGAFMIYYDKLASAYRKWGFIVMAGVISNMIDRVMRGGVVDYVNVGWFPVFNIADVLIVGGIIVISILLWREDEEDKEEENKRKRVRKK